MAHHKRRQIGKQQRTHGRHAVRADADKLVHDRKAAQYHPIADMHMAGQLGVVGKYGVIADLAVVRQVHIGHDPVVVTDTGDAYITWRPDIEGAKLADGVALADDQLTRLALIFFVLGNGP